MKKLEKLTLKSINGELPLLNGNELKEITGGGPDDNDCLFEAMSYLGNTLGCNSFSYNGWINEYGNTFGYDELINTLSGSGVQSDRAIDFLDNYFSVSPTGAGCSMEAGQRLGFLNVEEGGAHAVIITGTDPYGNVTYFDPQDQKEKSACDDEFAGAFDINCY